MTRLFFLQCTEAAQGLTVLVALVHNASAGRKCLKFEPVLGSERQEVLDWSTETIRTSVSCASDSQPSTIYSNRRHKNRLVILLIVLLHTVCNAMTVTEECYSFDFNEKSSAPSVSMANGQEEALEVSAALVPQGVLQRHVVLLQVQVLDGLQIKLQTTRLEQKTRIKLSML